MNKDIANKGGLPNPPLKTPRKVIKKPKNISSYFWLDGYLAQLVFTKTNVAQPLGAS